VTKVNAHARRETTIPDKKLTESCGQCRIAPELLVGSTHPVS